MNTIKKTKFYPVDIENKVIFDAPEARERDVAWKWRGKSVIGMSGKHLLGASVYKSYSITKDTGAACC